jgi:nitroreductase
MDEPLNQSAPGWAGRVRRAPSRYGCGPMDADTAIRTRRTHKQYGPDPVPRETVAELLELARWAPNHFVTEPWRFRVLGPETFERLIAAGGPNEREKLGRAPTLIVASARQTGDAHQNHEDVLATACAVYAVLLGATARGLGSYWRTPKLLQTPEGRAAVGLADDEAFVALIHLGDPRSDPVAKPRKPVEEYADFLP